MAESTLFLRKGRDFSKPDSINLSGIRLAFLDGEVTVYDVADESAAFIAGVRKNDVILDININGRSARQSELYELRDLLAESPSIVLRVRRKDEELTFSLAVGKAF